jgi:4-hydroxybenzoate polyprenyltransferase
VSGRIGAGAVAAPREGQTFSGESLLTRYASFVKLPHTLFALPFAGLGAVLAAREHPRAVTPMALFWIVLAFTAARFSAMGFNRIVDRHFDAENPRTRLRELPAGRLSVLQAGAAVTVAALLFVVAAFRLNPLCGFLAPVALVWVLFYSYTKRFTQWAHPMLGLALGIAPVGGYLAIAGAWSSPWYALVVLAAAVTFWVAGFDIIYSLQDVEYDRMRGLHSVAARQGPRRAIAIARLFHIVAVALFAAIRVFDLFPLGNVYAAGVVVMAGLLVYENVVAGGVRATPDLDTIDRAFFRTNVAVSLCIFAFTLLDYFVRT